ncbi:serine/threonine-protein kinase [Chondromyces crocatus]|uniref:Protein kinase n=1 Tax=Chondromyces crocatus TaxID=52 RepID=A0A0K1EL46_CHOCO|nr:serine/threonine-protein kinase [Chondromyces crocatus]AKT41585.1 protein kinase [Chondromyces crocatus]
MQTGDPFGWVGSTIDGQFAVEAPAGEGAFGIVYRGRHLGFDVPVAIKCLKIPADLGSGQRDEFLARFREEARLLHRLSRRTMGIVQAIDIGAAAAPNGQWAPYIVMEWLDGETLEQDLKRRRAEGRGARGLDEAIQLLAPVAAALSIAHEENVTHRDVKPANLFLAGGRDGDLIKVLDFGLAKVFAETPTVTEALAQTGRAFRAFTPQYGAPEQFSPRYGATGPWTDVYALALILVELAAGKPALAGSDVIQLFVASSDEAHRPTLRALGVESSPNLEAVLSRALAVNPAARYTNLGDMWAALMSAHRASARPLRDAAQPLPPLGARRDTLRVPAPLPSISSRPPGTREVISSGRGTTPIAPPPPLVPAAALGALGARSGEARHVSESPLVGPEAGENRVCTMMFVELSDAGALSARLDPEEVKDLLDRGFRLFAEQVERMDGVVEKPVAGRAMAIFGVPRSTEHDAERAVAAALGFQAALAHLRGAGAGAAAVGGSPAPRWQEPRSARGGRLSARIGLATGRVFVGPSGTASGDPGTLNGARAQTSTSSSRPDLTVIGEAVTAAARMQQAAPRGAIVIDRDTQRLVRHRFALEPFAAEPDLEAHRVLGSSAFLPDIAGAVFHGHETRLIGRGAQLNRLLMTVDEVIARREPRLTTLHGPPGVGRSRLLAELSASLVARGELCLLEARCSPLDRETSHALTASLLRMRFGIHPTDPATTVRHKLERGVRWLRLRTFRKALRARNPSEPPHTLSPLELRSTVRATTLAAARSRAATASGPPSEALGLREVSDVLGRVAAVLGAAPSSERDALARRDQLAGDTTDAKRRILEAMFRLAAFVLDRVPVVVVVDDLQWADDASLDLLEALTARADGFPLAVVCAARPELFDRRPRFREASPFHDALALAPLGRRDVEEMILDRLQRVPSPSPELVSMLADRAEGNPRTLEETLELLIDAGAIDTSADPWHVREAELGALSLPPTVQGLVQARLDRLDPEPRGVIALAAVVGRTFWEGAIDRLRKATPSGSSPRTSEPPVQLDDLDPPFSAAPSDLAARARDEGPTPTAELLALLCERNLVRARPSATFPGEREYTFTEGLVCDVAYEMLSVKVRRRIHLLVAEWLEQQVVGDASAALLALHHDRGGSLRDAAAAYARAASHALTVGDIAEARTLLLRVREIHDAATESDDHLPSVRRFPSLAGNSPAHLDGTQRSPSWEGADRRVAPWRDRVRLRLELGDLLRQTGDLEGAARTYDEARARILRVERRLAPAMDAREPHRWESRIDLRMALVCQARGAVQESLDLAQRARERASQSGSGGEAEAARALIEYLEASDAGPTLRGG